MVHVDPILERVYDKRFFAPGSDCLQLVFSVGSKSRQIVLLK